MKNVMRVVLASVVATSFAACGGGGGGGGGGSAPVIYYPYETVYGDVCQTQEASPGCTFLKSTGERIKVTDDPDYNRGGYGSDDLWYVKFDSSGKAAVYNDLGVFQYYANVSEFAGYVGGTTIGVGTTGFYWEDITNGTYWLGKNGVLYNANSGESNYGQAINDKTSSSASDTNFAALNSDANKELVKMASDRLMKEYGFKQDKAVAVASALNSWAVAAAERGTTSEKDMDKTFKAVFGVQFSDALAAAKDLSFGDNSGMQDLTNRSAAALGLKPHQAQKFMKGMYKKALANWGYDESSFNW
ncbi:hypothetical protein AB1A81_11135 [Bdellovibrio bacteriovorus]|uniref:Lipoprotein n=1 Tax=Bdellovibrio bacteriovorus (strain ATCC 15356 / DSM 50701 / NCIMB 9529 / HD100) TaxID=264462 RepID=Q6MKG6_BDEBA|nr:hypothetical protein [Bdellovibrio bacteriovorus]AHZ84949.1 hypothetical protein EP01_08360 [Bdellovibrio bacteriovorus]BEV68836.1 hypothetical protein Bb109J_c2256 [Bdellovibrio bacteriovorus]CAE80241.1 hypothetical protein predicted by Glimmer/Critica [Bdellovibrio bacteriovorus HD100]